MHLNEIDQKIKEAIDEMKSCLMQENRDQYIEFLTQTYFFVKHSIPLLKAAIKHTSNKEFGQRCLAHINEEHAHDLIVKNDLKKLGIDVSNQYEWEWTKNFYNHQYKLIEKEGELLLGYILALEGIAVYASGILKPLEDSYGKQATRFVKIHVEEDLEHMPEAIAQINNSKFKAEIYENFNYTVDQYKKFLKYIASIEDQGLLAA